MKNKLQKGMAIFLAIVLLQMVIIAPVKAYEIGEYASLSNYGYQACMSQNGNYIEIEQMMYASGEKNFPSYYYAYPKATTYQNRKTIRKGELADDYLRSIILAGYPYHSYQELGCYSEYPAYLATQLCILEYTQGEVLSNYQACDSNGYQVENAIQKIKENMANQIQPGQKPVFTVVADTDWEDYPYDPNYIVKTVHLACDGYYPETFNIQAEDSRVEILNENNYSNNQVYSNQTWKIRLPKTVEETGIELSLEISIDHYTDAMWLASSTENGEMFILTQDREETIKKTHTETIVKPEEPAPENPGTEDNSGEEKKDPPEDNVPDEPQKPEEKPQDKEENATTNNENTNQNENNNQNKQQVNLTFQPSIPIQNEIKQEMNLQVSVNPSIFFKGIEPKEEEEKTVESKPEQTTLVVQPKMKTSANKQVITASKINTKKLPRTGY